MDEPRAKGYTLWARQALDSDIFFWKPDKWFKIWFYIVNKVNWKDGNQFKRGQQYFTYQEIMDKTKATHSTVDHCIRYLKEATMIATRKATRGMVITVLNYDRYQSVDTYKSDTESDSKSDLKAKQKRNRSDTIIETRETRKQGNNKDIVEQVINHLNEKADKNFSPNTEPTINYINGRLGEGFTLADFLYVIDIKCSQWKDDPEQNKFLRPETLFCRKHFESYRNEKEVKSKTRADQMKEGTYDQEPF